MVNLHLNFQSFPRDIQRLFVAYSGGIDSAVLLHRLLAYKERYEIILWHINHGLQENANQMEALAQQQASINGLKYNIDYLDLSPEQTNLEARAREQRYKLFAAAMNDGDALLTAHHMNDQAETLLLNLMRGSGANGLRAIARQRPLGRGVLYRPLLDTQRSEIEAYAHHHRLEWIEDPSNNAMRFDRNYLRHRVLPVMVDRWPAAIQQLHRVAEWQNEMVQLHQDYVKDDYQQCAIKNPVSPYTCLNLASMRNFLPARQKNLLRYWMTDQGKKVLGYRRMEELLSQLESRADAMPIIQGQDFTLRRYQGHLYLVDPISFEVPSTILVGPSSEPVYVSSLALKLKRQDILRKYGLQDHQQRIELRFRQKLQDQTGTQAGHKLKRLFQRYQVPPWLRDITPQVWIDEKLMGLWIYSDGS